MRSYEWDLIQYDCCPYKERERPKGCRHTEEKPPEDTARKRPSASQGERAQEKPNLRTP